MPRRLKNTATCSGGRGRASRHDRRGAQRNAGFALIIVIWGLGVIALLIVSFMTSARLRLQAAANIAGAAQAELLAQAAINKSMLSLAKETNADAPPAQIAAGGNAIVTGLPPAPVAQRPVHDGRPRLCRLAGAAVLIAVEDEGGKVDLNVAPQSLLKAMLTGFGVGVRDADNAANAIAAFRSPPGDPNADAPSGGAAGAKHALYQTIYELDQVEGLNQDLVRDMLPFVTVHSRRAGVNPEAAPPALFAALSGYAPDAVQALRQAPFPNALDRDDPRFPSDFKQNGASGVFLIHAEALLASGQIGVWEVVVDMNPNLAPGAAAPFGSEPFAIRELRQASARYAESLRAAPSDESGMPDC